MLIFAAGGGAGHRSVHRWSQRTGPASARAACRLPRTDGDRSAHATGFHGTAGAPADVRWHGRGGGGGIRRRPAPGRAWVAPGDFHLALARDADGVRLRTHQGPPENSCRPSVDVLLRSAAEVYGSGVLAVVLTGMGHDGLRGCEQVRAAGGQVLVQDAASSVVWGMPGAVARGAARMRCCPWTSWGLRSCAGSARAAFSRFGSKRRPNRNDAKNSPDAGTSLLLEDFNYFRGLLRRCAAIVLEDEKAYLVEARLSLLAHREGFRSLGALATHLRTGGDDRLQRKVVEAMTTNETSFFRDGHPFHSVHQAVFPQLLRRRAAERSLTVWCAGCSSGQDPTAWRCCCARSSRRWTNGTSASSPPTSRRKCWRGAARPLYGRRGSPRPAGATAGEVLPPRRRGVAD